MIQEPTGPRQSTSPQTYEQETTTVTALRAIPIAISSHLNPRILLITTSPASRAKHQQQSPEQQTKQTQPRVARTRIIRVPFLPKSEPITLSVKEPLQTKHGSVKNSNQSTHPQDTGTQFFTQSQTVNTPTSTEYHYTCKPNTDSCSQSSYVTTPEAQAPMTLASMAGIQLTSADESHPDMSGAMPTATVEEINVPVFIDEYLQQSASAATTTSTPQEATAITINNNHNNGNGNENCIDDETFENFEFDFDMIADTTQEEQEYKMYLSNSNNNNNSNMDSYFSYSDAIINNNNNNNSYNTVNDNFLLSQEIKQESVDLEQQYHVLPYQETEELLSEDTLGPCIHDSNIFSTEEAIDISHFTNEEFSFEDIFTSSQHNPMMCETISISTNNSQTLITTAAEPLLPDYDQDFEELGTITKITNSQSSIPTLCEIACGGSIGIVKMDMNMETVEMKNNNSASSYSNGLKRSGARLRSSSQSMAKKRSKLRLDTSRPYVPAEDLKTPDVINLITEMSKDENNMRSTNNINTADIVSELLNCSNSSFQSVTTEIYTSLTSFNDDESPSTPQSFTSSTNHTTLTGNYTTSPNSPAFSTYSSSKKKRGRPSKEHSDRPDPSEMQRLSENDRKRREDRFKNNEASRLSRLKNKAREDAEVEDEKRLTKENTELRAALKLYETQTKKMKRALKRSFGGPLRMC